jgi:hypothetical protein
MTITDSLEQSPFTMLSKRDEFLDISNTHTSFSCPEVFDLGVCSLSSTYNTRPDTVEGYYTQNSTTSCQRPLCCSGRECSESQTSEHCGSLAALGPGLSHLQRNDSSSKTGCAKPCEYKRDRSSRRLKLQDPQNHYVKINLVLDMLPWIAGLIWVATIFFGGR